MIAPTPPAHPTHPHSAERDRGMVLWGVIVAVLMVGVTMILANSYLGLTGRSGSNTNQVAITHRTDAAVADAIARLSSGASVPATRETSTAVCEEVTGRNVCYQYWALPVPGNAVDPMRYNLISNAWVDTDRTGRFPTDQSRVRAIMTPLRAITYQNVDPLKPSNINGQILYTPTPAGLFSNALHAFSNVTLAGTDVSVESYNSAAGTNGTKNGTVSSGSVVSYGRATSADTTLLYGQSGPSTVTPSRCTGEACTESDVLAVSQAYAPPSDAANAWITNTTSCTTTVNGSWVASENGGKLPNGTLCIKGALIIDVPTALTSASSTLYVQGNVQISSSLNAPDTGRVATPGRLAIYSAGKAVSFSATVATSPGTGISAMLWAPSATCSTDPANAKIDGAHTGQFVYFGSLVCNTISLGGSWRHLLDDAQLTSYKDPVPDSDKAWTVGTPEQIDTSPSWDVPAGWADPLCVLPSPVNAAAYWKLSEPSGLLAADSAGTNALGWASSTGGRETGVCGRGAALAPAAQVTGGSSIVSATAGVSLEWWGKATVGNVAQVAGVTANMDSTRHVFVTAGGATYPFAFTVQNSSSWHLYTITVSNAGDAILYVDGQRKETVKVGSPSTGGPTILAKGSAGVISDVVTYRRVLTQAEISERWTTWNMNVVFTASDAGTPFTAPTNVRNNGSVPTSLKIAWNASTGTLPAGEATYVVERSTTVNGTFTKIGEVPVGTTTFTQANPPAGSFYYRVCTAYNGDTRCSSPAVEILTITIPTAPVVTASEQTQTTAKFSWTTPTYTERFESQVRLNGGSWYGTGGAADSLIQHALSETSRVHGPTPAGWQIEVRVRAVNAAGTGPWSATVGTYTKPAPPVVSFSGMHYSGGTLNWTVSGLAARTEHQFILYSDTVWFGDYRGDGLIHSASATSGSRAVSAGEQGTKWTARVRTVSGDGSVSAWVTATANQAVQNAVANSWHITGTSPTNTITNIVMTCPSGNYPYTRSRDMWSRATSWGAWNAWTQSGNTQMSANFASLLRVGDGGHVDTQAELRCRNPLSGQTSSSSVAYSYRFTGAGADMYVPVDRITTTGGAIRVGGWGVNRAFITAGMTIHVYIDDGTPNQRGMACAAINYRADLITNVPGIGGYHGYDCGFSGVSAGTHRLLMYAIDQYGQGYVVYQGNVNVTK